MSTTPPVFTDSTECNNYVKKLFVENNVEPKKTFWGFVWGELIALIAQVMVFGSAFALTSNFFDDKEKAVQIFSEKSVAVR